jgi:segregation and condensation protein A
MLEKTIPWWRRAFKFALDGIRSRFGLFSRPSESEAVVIEPEAISSKPETVTVANSSITQQKIQEENTTLTEASPQTEIAAAEPLLAEPVAEPLPTADSKPAAAPIPVAEPEVAIAPVPLAEPETAAAPIQIAALADPILALPELVEPTEAPAEALVDAEPEADQKLEEVEAIYSEDKIEIESALYQGTTSVVPQMQQKDDRALAPEICCSGTPVEAPVEPEPEPEESTQTETKHEVVIESSSEPEPMEVVELIVEPEAVIEPAQEQIDAVEAVVEAVNVMESIPEPLEAVTEAAPPAAPPLLLTPQPTAEEQANKIAAEKAAAKLAARQKKLDESSEQSPFSVIVGQVYDGPLDLLLDLIRKQDIDIYDIPIATITAQFLAYVNQLKAGDVDVAGEFIYTASLLIHIKSRMLLPRADHGPEEAAEDPRRELVERLLEHERFKNAAQMLQQKQMLEAATWTNPGAREFKDDAAAEPEIAADTVDLVRIFRDILERARSRPVIDLEEDSVTVGQMIQFLARRLSMEDKPIALRRLLSHTHSERALIAMFLALLELVRLQAILLRQDLAFSEIFIKKHTGFDNVMSAGLMQAQDDWR